MQIFDLAKTMRKFLGRAGTLRLSVQFSEEPKQESHPIYLYACPKSSTFAYPKENTQMLQADNISIRFGDEHVLDRFSCHIEQGAFVCITGMSGCGKTSLLKSFLGLVPLTEGTIRVGEYTLNEHTCSAIRRSVAYLPQDLLLPYDTVNETVCHVLKIGDLRYKHSSALQLHENIVKLGLDDDLLEKRLAEISGGQRQRLMLAALALLDKPIWLLDEPTAALDKVSRDYVITFLIEQQKRGKTIVAISHDHSFAAQCTATIRLG